MDAVNIVVNVHNQYVRRDKLHGREYIVAPVNLLTEGVHAGSNGPLFYPSGELSKMPDAWNTRPVVVYHPAQGTATTHAELSQRQVGILLNTRWDASRKKLRSEAWLDEDRLRAIAPEVLHALERNEPMEVSTGVYTDNAFAPGVHNGRGYEFEARSYVPDHLAILPKGVGACSIAAGCGMLTANEEQTMETPLIAPTINWQTGALEPAGTAAAQVRPVANAAPQQAGSPPAWEYLEVAVVEMEGDNHPDAYAARQFIENQKAAANETPLMAPTMNFGHGTDHACGCGHAATAANGYGAGQPAHNATGGHQRVQGGETPLLMPTMQFDRR